MNNTKHCYIIISPNPRHWAPLAMPVGQAQVPGVTAAITPPQGATNFFIKIGSQTGNNGALAAYRRSNPSFFWANIEVTNYVAPQANPNRTLGKELEIQIIGGLPGRMLALGLPAEVFKHIQHGEEWYYCFNNQARLLQLMNYLENNRVPGQDYVRFQNANAARTALEGWFRTAT